MSSRSRVVMLCHVMSCDVPSHRTIATCTTPYSEDYDACDKERAREAIGSGATVRFATYDPQILPPGADTNAQVKARLAEFERNAARAVADAKPSSQGHDLGYSGMLRFFAGLIFEHPIMHEG